MERYKNLGGDSGIAGFEYGDDYIRVRVSDGAVYLYTYGSAGGRAIEDMKVLADRGEGLNAYINARVRKRYARKER
jgi:hypothetical protein